MQHLKLSLSIALILCSTLSIQYVQAEENVLEATRLRLRETMPIDVADAIVDLKQAYQDPPKQGTQAAKTLLILKNKNIELLKKRGADIPEAQEALRYAMQKEPLFEMKRTILRAFGPTEEIAAQIHAHIHQFRDAEKPVDHFILREGIQLLAERGENHAAATEALIAVVERRGKISLRSQKDDIWIAAQKTLDTLQTKDPVAVGHLTNRTAELTAELRKHLKNARKPFIGLISQLPVTPEYRKKELDAANRIATQLAEMTLLTPSSYEALLELAQSDPNPANPKLQKQIAKRILGAANEGLIHLDDPKFIRLIESNETMRGYIALLMDDTQQEYIPARWRFLATEAVHQFADTQDPEIRSWVEKTEQRIAMNSDRYGDGALREIANMRHAEVPLGKKDCRVSSILQSFLSALPKRRQ